MYSVSRQGRKNRHNGSDTPDTIWSADLLASNKHPYKSLVFAYPIRKCVRLNPKYYFQIASIYTARDQGIIDWKTSDCHIPIHRVHVHEEKLKLVWRVNCTCDVNRQFINPFYLQ